MHDMLRKFVDVMTRKFIHSRKAPHAHGVDDFYGIEENGPDEALIKPPLSEDPQAAIDLARVVLGMPIDKNSKVLGYNYGINRCDACKKSGVNICTH